MEPIEGTSKTFNSGGDFGMEKLSKSNELNESMSITPQGRDDYESKLFSHEAIVTGKQIGRAHV